MIERETTYVEIDYDEIVAQTDNAILFNFGDDAGELWIPKTLIKYEEDDPYGEEWSGTVQIAEWLATQRGLV